MTCDRSKAAASYFMWESLYPPLSWDVNQPTWPNADYSCFVQTPFQRWHVQIAGQGPTLLLLHGTGASTHSWRNLLPVLSQHFTVVCPDLPGHAFSASRGTFGLSLENITACLSTLLDALGQWPDAIVGHSAGAAIAAQLILENPERSVPRLIGLNPAWLPLPGMANWLFPPAAKLMALNPWSARWFSKQAAKPGTVQRLIEGTGSKLDPSGIALYQRLMQAPAHVNGVLGMMASWQLDHLARRLPQLRTPILMHIGANDLAIPATLAQQALALMPQAELVSQPGMGHIAHEEDPAATCQVIVKWLKQTGR